MKANGLRASKQSTQSCHLSSMLPGATHRLSLCKTDICPGAFFLSFFSPLDCLFLFFSFCNLFYIVYLIFQHNLVLSHCMYFRYILSLKKGKMSPRKMTFKICDAEKSTSGYNSLVLKCLRKKATNTLNECYMQNNRSPKVSV